MKKLGKLKKLLEDNKGIFSLDLTDPKYKRMDIRELVEMYYLPEINDEYDAYTAFTNDVIDILLDLKKIKLKTRYVANGDINYVGAYLFNDGIYNYLNYGNKLEDLIKKVNIEFETNSCILFDKYFKSYILILDYDTVYNLDDSNPFFRNYLDLTVTEEYGEDLDDWERQDAENAVYRLIKMMDEKQIISYIYNRSDDFDSITFMDEDYYFFRNPRGIEQ